MVNATLTYRDFADYLRERFPLFKVQKISIDAGFTCPNRDGSKGLGGCIYCNNSAFVPAYHRRDCFVPRNDDERDCFVPRNDAPTEKIVSLKERLSLPAPAAPAAPAAPTSIAEQLKAGINFFSRKYKSMRYIAYFQAYTNTYAPLETLRRRYEEALSVEGVVGLIIGTRPDCVPDATLDYIAELNRQTFVMLEYGIESASDTTLQRINRCHSYAEAEDAVCRTAARNVPVGAHIILGLPGETREEMLQHADRLSSLPLTSVKLHQLQLVRGTLLERGGEYGADNLTLFTLDEYIETVKDFIARLRPDIYIDRFVSQSPPELVIAPRWGVKNHEFRNLLRKRGVTWNRRN